MPSPMLPPGSNLENLPPEALTAALENAQPMELGDGSATVDFTDQLAPQPRFDDNLADGVLQETLLQTMSTDLKQKIDQDKKAREKRDKQYEEGIRRSGLGNDTPGGAEFEGASKATHPMLAEASVDFAAMAMRELFPPDGPVKPKVYGEDSKQKGELGERQSKGLNWQLTAQMPEYAEELEQLLTQLPMGGSQYMKFWKSRDLGRSTCEFVPVDDYLLPFTAGSFDTAHRRTHVQRLTDAEVEGRVDSGFYRDVKLAGTGGLAPEQTASAKATAKVEGKEDPGLNLDGERIVYEVDCYLKLEIDGGKRLPYLVSIDNVSGSVLAVYRNWDPEDRRQKRLDWIVEYGFVPWRGAYKIGWPHLIGGLSVAATGALRALLDSAHINNAAAAVKLKGAGLSGANVKIGIGEINELEAPPSVDDIRKLVMPLPYNQPSPVLYELLGWLTQAAKGVVTTAEEKIADATNNMPVGTTLALIEQGGKVMSSIHARLHRSQRRALQILARIDSTDPEFEQSQMEELGEVLVTSKELGEGIAVDPVSDPNIYSDAQRYAQVQALLQMSTDQRVQYDVHEIHRRLLQVMRIPQADEILPPKQEPQPTNPAAENAALLLGKPLFAFPQQDHLSHLESHLRFVGEEMITALFLDDYPRIANIFEHVRQHVAYFYSFLVEKAMRAAGIDSQQLEKPMQQQPQLQVMLDTAVAAASKQIQTLLAKHLQSALPVVQMLKLKLDALKPPTPMDPTAVAMADVERRKAADQTTAQLKSGDQQLKQGDQALKAQAQRDKKQIDTANVGIAREDLVRETVADQQDVRLEEESLANERLKLAAQLREDQEPGNQFAGV